MKIYPTLYAGGASVFGRTTSLAIMLFVVLSSPNIWAQSLLEEIVVTAQKREQNIQDVGIAITAFSGDQLEALGLEFSTDISRFTPNVHHSAIGAQITQFTIRGVSQNDFTESVEAPIAVYIDEGYIATQNGQVFSTFDTERVEIAKGPQGTLFGRNATGGMVHFVSRKPTDEFEGYADATFGSYDQFQFKGALSGPLSERWTGRLAVTYRQHDGVLNNLVTPAGDPNLTSGGMPLLPDADADLYNDDTWAARAHIQFTPNDDLEMLFTAFGTQSRLSSDPLQIVSSIAHLDEFGRHINTTDADPTETREAIGPGGVNADANGDFVVSTRPIPGGDFYGYIDFDGDGFDYNLTDAAFKDINENDIFGGTIKIDWERGNTNFTSISDFKHYEKYLYVDTDGPTNGLIFVTGQEVDAFTQELRANGATAKTRWVVGFYYLQIDNRTDTGFVFPLGPPGFNFSFTNFLTGVDDINEIQLDTKSYSLFGQLEYDLTNTVTLVMGLRATQEEKDYQLDQNFYLDTDEKTIDTEIPVDPVTFFFPPFPGPTDSQIAPTYTNDTSDTLWTAKVQLDWRPKDDLLVYAGFNRGVKAGSFNAPITFGFPLPFESIPYDEEVLHAYEIGVKSTVGGTTRINAAVFYYDYMDYQASVFDSVSVFISNNDAEIYGGELEITSNPSPGLDLLLSIGYTNATVKDVLVVPEALDFNFQVIAPGIFRDVEPTFVPEWTIAGILRYEFQNEVFGGTLAVQGDVNYVSKIWQNLRNFDAHQFDSYTLGGARLTWTSHDDSWQTTLFVRNIGDERNSLVSFDNSAFGGSYNVAYGLPRWSGITVRYSW